MVVVAIQSNRYRGKYVTLEASGVTSFSATGAGAASTATFVGPNETYRLINNADGTLSFACTAFTNVYLRADSSGLVNAQFGLGPTEKFFVRRPENAGKTYNGIVGLELAAFPGRFLRVHQPGGKDKVDVQSYMSTCEQFEIMVVGALQSSVV